MSTYDWNFKETVSQSNIMLHVQSVLWKQNIHWSLNSGNTTTQITPLNSWSFHCAVCIQVTSTTIFTEFNQRATSSRAEVLKSREAATVALEEKKKRIEVHSFRFQFIVCVNYWVDLNNNNIILLYIIYYYYYYYYSLCELLSWFDSSNCYDQRKKTIKTSQTKV